MTNLNPEICRKIRDARRNAGVSQSTLSAEVGCKQSALSMFEQGDGTKLNDDVINKLAKKFGIDLCVGSKTQEEGRGHAFGVMTGGQFGRGFCPNPECPSNHGYEVGGKKFLKPQRDEADPIGGKYCAICGEILEKRCPNCGAPVHDGAVCSVCGGPYIALS